MSNQLNIRDTDFKDLHIIEPNVFEDSRGSFSKLFCIEELGNILNGEVIEQINYSITYKKGTFRGLHFQYPPYSEVKIVKCIRGSILDVVVDIRKGSLTFLKSFFIELSDKNKKMIFIPKGFAHGFQTLEDNVELLYLHTQKYVVDKEGALNIKDPLLNIKLPLDITYLSERDKKHKFLTEDFEGIKI